MLFFLSLILNVYLILKNYIVVAPEILGNLSSTTIPKDLMLNKNLDTFNSGFKLSAEAILSQYPTISLDYTLTNCQQEIL